MHSVKECQKSNESHNDNKIEQEWEDYEKNGFKNDDTSSNNDDPLCSLYNRRKIDISRLKGVLTEKSRHGLTGSSNLGNTCFMNSSIACMSNTIELTTYFLTKDYKSEVNKSNPLGLNGKLAKAWYELLYEFWVENNKAGNASNFKNTISQKAKQFSGFSQHDSHELMVYFLDTLNEDLNKVSKKPYIEIDEQKDNESDVAAAKRYWDLHLQRNDSIITDLFSGQFKTTVQCPECRFVSKTYDPFTTLSLPIPSSNAKNIFYIPKFNLRKPIKVALNYCNFSLIGNLVHLISSNPEFTYKINKLRYMIVNEKKFITFPGPYEKISDMIKLGFVFCIEDDIDSEKGDKMYPLYLGTEEHKDLSAYPRVIVINKNMTYNDLFKIIYIYARRYINVPFDEDKFEEECEKLNEDHDAKEDELIKKLSDEYETIFNNNANSNEKIKNFLNDLPFELSIVSKVDEDDPNEIVLLSKKQFATKTDDEKKKNYYPEYTFNEKIDKLLTDYLGKKRYLMLRILKDSPNYKKKSINLFNCCSFVKNINPQLTLSDCIEAFRMTEQLDDQNEWYCKKCKKHQRAIKKMELFYLPKLLIIHLKRFNNSRRSYYEMFRKDDTYINFPIDELDMSNLVAGPQKGNIKYELYAVSQHYGGCGGGHYTAVAKNYGEWYSFNDSSVSSTNQSDIVSSAAYVIFYRRKD